MDDEEEHRLAREVAAGSKQRSRQQQTATSKHNKKNFFPQALAVDTSAEQWQFNFDLFLYDTLRLACRLHPDNASHGDMASRTIKCFPNMQKAAQAVATWSEEYEDYISEQAEKKTHASCEAARKKLNKKAIFQTSGKPSSHLKVGQGHYDANIEKVRLDLFGNVMCLSAPHWSDIAVQLTHGFPNRLIKEAHGGYTPENVTCASRVSNQLLRRFASSDVAAFVSRTFLTNTGMSLPELIYARQESINFKKDNVTEGSVRLLELMFR